MPLSSILLSPLVPACLPAAALLVRRGDPARCWSTADWLVRGTALAVLLQWLCRGVSAPPLQPLMLLLVLFLAWVIVRFSQVYLQGETSQHGYVHLVATTASAACAVIAAPRLDILLGAWVVVSLAMNSLLQHYPERRPAQLAAHKKFLVSRLGELSFALGCLVLDRCAGTLSIAEINRLALLHGMQSRAWQAGVLLLVIGVLLKTAQVPLHGWLMQVMEAPTPVSALLHAGVVNLGGIVLVRLSPLLDASPAAQVLLVACGCTTMLLAGVVSTTRVSIKVRLAWLTCAQMGFLMAECGLGLYQLAVLHLIGHSLYKAHAFLTSGSAVQVFRREHGVLQRPLRPVKALAADAAAGILSVACVYATYRALLHGWHTVETAAILTVGIALAPALRLLPSSARRLPLALTRFVPLLALYFGWHFLLNRVLHDGSGRPAWLVALFSVPLLSLYVLQSLISNRVALPWMNTVRRWAFHGFYLDESVSRLALAVWPARYHGHDAQQPALTAAYVKELA